MINNAFTVQNGLVVRGSTEISGSLFLSGSMESFGSMKITNAAFDTITASIARFQTLHIQTITSSIVYSSGSNTFGNSQSNVHQFTGSVEVTGSITGNLIGSASFSQNSISASNSITASHALNVPALPAIIVSSSAQLSNEGGTPFTSANNITVGEVTGSRMLISGSIIPQNSSSILLISGSASGSTVSSLVRIDARDVGMPNKEIFRAFDVIVDGGLKFAIVKNTDVSNNYYLDLANGIKIWNRSGGVGIMGGGDAGFNGVEVSYSLGFSTSNASSFNAADTWLHRDNSANIIGMRNGTNNQSLRVYKTYTDANNFERLTITSGSTIHLESAGTGMANRNMTIRAAGTGSVLVSSSLALVGFLTSSQPLVVRQTWSASAQNFDAILADITNTAASNAYLLRLRSGGTDRFILKADGGIATALSLDNTVMNTTGPGAGIRIGDRGTILWSSDQWNPTFQINCGLSKNSTTIETVEVNRGSRGNLGDLAVRTINPSTSSLTVIGNNMFVSGSVTSSIAALGTIRPTTGSLILSGSALVTGDIEFPNYSGSIILKSPNGTRWRLTVDNSGVLGTTLA